MWVTPCPVRPWDTALTDVLDHTKHTTVVDVVNSTVSDTPALVNVFVEADANALASLAVVPVPRYRPIDVFALVRSAAEIVHRPGVSVNCVLPPPPATTRGSVVMAVGNCISV